MIRWQLPSITAPAPLDPLAATLDAVYYLGGPAQRKLPRPDQLTWNELMNQDYQGPAAEGQMRILTFPNVRTYTWKPQEDITTYELALCMPLMAVGTTRDGWMQMNSMYDALPAEAQRHWSVEGKAEVRL